MKKSNVLVLTECSIMIALSAVLSIIPIFEMPYGGSITLASFLPIVIVAYRHGIKCGLAAAGASSLVQMLFGMKNFSYFTTWQSLVALALFDYVIAFTVFGLAGVFRKKINQQSAAMVTGAALASVIRYICHVISGATVWAGLSIPTEAALLYSLSYNATYMIPETIILVLSTAYIGASLDFRTKLPVRMKNEKFDKRSSLCLTAAGLVALAGLITDTVLVFSKLQNYDSGEFTITALADVNWTAFAIVTASAAVIAGTITIVTFKINSSKQTSAEHKI